MASDKITEITNENFENEVLKADKPVLVDFWATWCGPCKRLGPVIDEIAEEVGDKIKVCKLDVDLASEIASNYQVMSVPTVLFFKNGEIVSQQVGAMPKASYLNVIATL